jgi:hypothetical protein
MSSGLFCFFCSISGSKLLAFCEKNLQFRVSNTQSHSS